MRSIYLPPGERKLTPKVTPGDIVHIRDRFASYGIVEDVMPQFRVRPLRAGTELRYRVRFIDSATGLAMVCPDRRCRDGDWTTCPICQIHLWGDELEKFSEEDIRVFQEEGMLATAPEAS